MPNQLTLIEERAQIKRGRALLNNFPSKNKKIYAKKLSNQTGVWSACQDHHSKLLCIRLCGALLRHGQWLVNDRETWRHRHSFRSLLLWPPLVMNLPILVQQNNLRTKREEKVLALLPSADSASTLGAMVMAPWPCWSLFLAMSSDNPKAAFYRHKASQRERKCLCAFVQV